MNRCFTVTVPKMLWQCLLVVRPLCHHVAPKSVLAEQYHSPKALQRQNSATVCFDTCFFGSGAGEKAGLVSAEPATNIIA